MKKNTGSNTKWLIIALIISLSFSLNSCKDDDLPDYVGTWERSDDSELGAIKQTLKITETTFVMNMTLNLMGTWVDMMVVKGTFTIDGELFQLKITEVGLPNETFTAIEYFTPDDLNWAQILDEEVEVPETFEAKFVVSGDQLTLITDDNEDGTFDPVEEGEVFTRK